jgi:hypothetical protein
VGCHCFDHCNFRIEKAKGSDGHEIDVKKQFTIGMAMFVTMLAFPFCDLIHLADILCLSVAYLCVVLHKGKGVSS